VEGPDKMAKITLVTLRIPVDIVLIVLAKDLFEEYQTRNGRI
jgi:hypothetical protein